MKESHHIYTDFSSPNFDKRQNKKIDTVVIHATQKPFSISLKTYQDKFSKISCHYLINLDGKIYQLVPDQMRAWHAGLSYWRGRTSLNDTSIGIELIDTTDQNIRIKKFPKLLMESLISLLKLLVKKYKIPNSNIVAHSDIAPDRKDDPGEYFDWQLLAYNGIGNYHNINSLKEKDSRLMDPNSAASQIKEIQKMLNDYGYKIDITGKFDAQTKEVITAFRRRFNPKHLEKSYFSKVDFKILYALLN